MSVNHPHKVTCSCGNSFVALLADSVNAGRMPKVREMIISGTFHRVACPKCLETFTVERPFFYTDLVRNVFMKVMPPSERHRAPASSASLDRAVAAVPESLAPQTGRRLRVVFGLAELREKLIAEDAHLDDRLVELLKVFIVADHPFLIKRPRLQLLMDSIDNKELKFHASYEHDQHRYSVVVPRWLGDNLLAKSDTLEKWVRKNDHPDGMYAAASTNHWVSIGRFSSEPSSLELLHSYAADVSAGKPLDSASPAFKKMLAGLPSGNHLPGSAKQDLAVLFGYAKKENLGQLEDTLFELRFGFTLADDWSTNKDPDDIDVLWKLLKDLPDSNVEGNTFIHELLLSSGGGGVYSPSTKDITIGEDELSNREGFEDVVRHEVGHAVHEQNTSLVTDWLRQRFGWQTFPATAAGINQWIGLMQGGWSGIVDATQRAQIVNYLLTALGPGGSWLAGTSPTPPAGHPWWGKAFGPRLAVEQTHDYWYEHDSEWFRSNGHAFFLNYWYQTFIAVDTSTLDLIAKMPSNYASMSHYEFFAELYSLYYDLDDPARPNIPADVEQWLDQNIGKPELNAPAQPSAPPKKEAYEIMTRPGKPTKKKGVKIRPRALRKPDPANKRKPSQPAAMVKLSKPDALLRVAGVIAGLTGRMATDIMGDLVLREKPLRFSDAGVEGLAKPLNKQFADVEAVVTAEEVGDSENVKTVRDVRNLVWDKMPDAHKAGAK